jgi:dTDP-4-dehydrorhamnose reductase
MKVLIVGASGLVGSRLLRACQELHWQVIGTYNKYYVRDLISLNIIDNDQIKLIFYQYQPQIVFLPAFISNVDYCEQYPEKSHQVNVIGSLNIIRNCQENKAKLIFYSSDYIFNGKNGAYKESDKPDPICVYGKQKLFIENYISNLLSNYLILRITVVYGYEAQRKNFLIRLIRNLRNKQVIKAPIDQIGSPTLADDIAKASCDLVKQNTQGIFHLTSSDIMSRYEFAIQAAKSFNLSLDNILPVQTDQLLQISPRPLNAGLISERLQSYLDWKLNNVNQGLIYLANNQDFIGLINHN